MDPTNNTKFVDFFKYCNDCAWKNVEENCFPCNECLLVPAREGTEKPERFISREK